MKLNFVILIICFSIDFPSSSFGNKVAVEHALDDGSFSLRGKLVLMSNSRDANSRGLTMRDDFDTLDQAFDNIENVDLYKLRIPVIKLASGELQSGGALKGHLDTFIPMAFLRSACFAHEVHVYIDQLGTAFGLSILPLTCANTTQPVSVKVFQTESLSGPDTKSFLQKVEEERARKARQPVDNRSFFQKYWIYIIVGLFAFTLLSGSNQQQNGGGEG